jgi:uncharacterized iron-regulated membrane protein
VKAGFRQSMAWLHTWSGLLFGWLLFAVFATGTSAYFQEEITAWMQPEVHARVGEPAAATQAAAGWLRRTAPDSPSWFITPPGKRSAVTQVYWEPGPDTPADAKTQATLGGDGEKVAARETRGGNFLYRFHYDLHYMPVIWARWIVGVAAMFMLIAILSGIVTHKKIFADFFLLRLGKGQRSWLDAHNVTGVLVLPFYLMITYTGLVTLATQYMPWGIAANYPSADKFFEEAFPYATPPERSGKAVPLAPIASMMARASHEWGGRPVGYVRVINPGDATATVEISASRDDAMSARSSTLTFDGTTGKLAARQREPGGARTTEGVMIGLHIGRYAGDMLRWLYFLSGLAGTAMVATGLILWTVKRHARLPDPERPHLGFRIVEKLNIAAIAGVPIAIAVYFLANRLIPPGLAGRGDGEIRGFFIAWGAAAIWALARPAPRAWPELLAAAALLFAAVPLASALTTPRNLLASLAAGDSVFAGFELALLCLAAAFGWAARKASRRRPAATPARRHAPAGAAA